MSVHFLEAMQHVLHLTWCLVTSEMHNGFILIYSQILYGI